MTLRHLFYSFVASFFLVVGQTQASSSCSMTSTQEISSQENQKYDYDYGRIGVGSLEYTMMENSPPINKMNFFKDLDTEAAVIREAMSASKDQNEHSTNLAAFAFELIGKDGRPVDAPFYFKCKDEKPRDLYVSHFFCSGRSVSSDTTLLNGKVSILPLVTTRDIVNAVKTLKRAQKALEPLKTSLLKANTLESFSLLGFQAGQFQECLKNFVVDNSENKFVKHLNDRLGAVDNSGDFFEQCPIARYEHINPRLTKDPTTFFYYFDNCLNDEEEKEDEETYRNEREQDFLHSEQLALFKMDTNKEFENFFDDVLEKVLKQEISGCVLLVYNWNGICKRCCPSILIDFYKDGGLKDIILRKLNKHNGKFPKFSKENLDPVFRILSAAGQLYTSTVDYKNIVGDIIGEGLDNDEREELIAKYKNVIDNKLQKNSIDGFEIRIPIPFYDRAHEEVLIDIAVNVENAPEPIKLSLRIKTETDSRVHLFHQYVFTPAEHAINISPRAIGNLHNGRSTLSNVISSSDQLSAFSRLSDCPAFADLIRSTNSSLSGSAETTSAEIVLTHQVDHHGNSNIESKDTLLFYDIFENNA